MHRLFVLFFILISFLTPLHATAGNNLQLLPVSVELRLVENEPKPGILKALDPENGTAIYLHKKAIIDTSQIINAKVTIDVLDEPHVEITLNPEAAKKFHDFTRANITRRLATLVDGKVVDVAIIREPITSGLCQFSTPTRQEAERIVRGIAPPLPSMRGFTPEDVARAYFKALQDRGMSIVVDFMHSGEMAKFKSIFIAVMEKEATTGKRELVSLLFGEQATLAEVKALSPKEFMSVFMQKASGLLPKKTFTFEKQDMIGSLSEGELMHVVARIEVGIWPVAIKKMVVVSMKRDGDEWKLLLTEELDGLLQTLQSDLKNK
jgi:hypothetical protein